MLFAINLSNVDILNRALILTKILTHTSREEHNAIGFYARENEEHMVRLVKNIYPTIGIFHTRYTGSG